MAKGQSWSLAEVGACVADYFDMLRQEIAGQTYSKTAHRRRLQTRLVGRSDSAIELKHQNISGVLVELERTRIRGYLPRNNYQLLLAEEVVRWLDAHPEFDEHALAAAEAPAAERTAFDFATFQVETVLARESTYPRVKEPDVRLKEVIRRGRKVDYAAREARNSSLGLAGELLVLEYERFRLRAAGEARLADRIEHVSATQGDGLGFDILSFDASGRERFIEVKTTTFQRETPFFASENERRLASREPDRFELLRLYEFRHHPKALVMPGDLAQYCALDPISYRCTLR